MEKAWAGVDAGKEFHWAHVLDASGRELLSLGRSKTTRPTSPSSSTMLCFWLKRSFGLWINPEAVQRSCSQCFGSETRESSTSLVSP